MQIEGLILHHQCSVNCLGILQHNWLGKNIYTQTCIEPYSNSHIFVFVVHTNSNNEENLIYHHRSISCIKKTSSTKKGREKTKEGAKREQPWIFQVGKKNYKQ
jgi:hypothetical protein